MTAIDIATEILRRTGDHPDELIGEDGDRFWAAIATTDIDPYGLALDIAHENGEI